MTKISKKIQLSLMLGIAGFTAAAMVPSVTFAASAEEESYSYVSLGDSMTTGFGYDDYYVDGESGTKGVDYKNEMGHKNVRGFLVNASEAYPTLIKTELEKTHKNVTLTQMAANASRIDDIYYNITGDTNTDEFYQAIIDADADGEAWNKIWGNRAVKKGYATQAGNAGVNEAYQNAIANADLITLNAGFNNFGCFITGKLSDFIEAPFPVSIFGNFGGHDTLEKFIERQDLDIDLDKLYSELYAVVKDIFDIDLKQYEDIKLGDNITVHAKKLVETAALGFISYCWYMNATTKAIYALNPDVELVVLGLYNNQKGLNFTYGDTEISLEKVLNYLYDAANTFTTCCCEKADWFKYVVLSETDVENHFDRLKTLDLDESEWNRVYEGISTLASTFLGTDDLTPQFAKYLYWTPYEDLLSPAMVDPKNSVMLIVDLLQQSAALPSIDVNQLMEAFQILSSGDSTAIQVALMKGTFNGLLNLYTRMLLSNGIWSHPSADGHIAIATEALKTINNPSAPSAREIGMARVEAKVKEIIKVYGDKIKEGIIAYVTPYIAEVKAEITAVFQYYNDQLNQAIKEASEDVAAQLRGLQQRLNAIYTSIMQAFDALGNIAKMSVQQIIEQYNVIMEQVRVAIAQIQAQIEEAMVYNRELIIIIEKVGTAAQMALVQRTEASLLILYNALEDLYEIVVYQYMLEDVNYVWGEECKTCKAVITLINGQVIVEDGEIESKVVEQPTLHSVGTTEYTATFKHVEVATCIVSNIPELEVVEQSYDWTIEEDSLYCVATCTLSDGSTYTEITFDIDVVETKHPTLDEEGELQFTATFEEVKIPVAQKTVPVEKLEIVTDTPEWAEDGSACTSHLTLSDGSTLDEVGTISDVELVHPTLDDMGTTRYTAEFEHAAKKTKDIVDIAKLTIVSQTETWAEDGSTCVAHLVLSDESEIDENGKISSSETKHPTLDVKGETTYVASFEHAESKTLVLADIDKLTVTGHSYTWADNGSSCIAHLVLSDSTEIDETGEITHSVTKKPTLDEMGVTTYTASFKHVDTSTKAITNVDKLTVISSTYAWNADHTKCTATMKLSDGSTLKEDSLSVVHKTNKVATLDNKGEEQYDATFAHANATVEKVSVAQLTITDTKYEWSNNNTTCVATLKLSNGTTITENGSVNAVVTKKASIDGKGLMTFTAKFDHAANAVTTTDIPQLSIKNVAYQWAADGSSCKALVTLSDNSTFTEDGVMGEPVVTLKPTLYEMGKTTYSATFAHAGSDTLTLTNIEKLKEDVKDDGKIITTGDNLANGVDIVVKDTAEKVTVISDKATVAFDKAATESLKNAGAKLLVEVNGQLIVEDAAVVIEVNLVDAKGTKVNFDGVATISVAFDQTIPEGKELNLYYINGTKLEKVDYTLEQGVLTFSTFHFSAYAAKIEAVPVEPVVTTPFPAWAIALIAVAGAAAVAAVVVVAVKKSKKAAK